MESTDPRVPSCNQGGMQSTVERVAEPSLSPSPMDAGNQVLPPGPRIDGAFHGTPGGQAMPGDPGFDFGNETLNPGKPDVPAVHNTRPLVGPDRQPGPATGKYPGTPS